MGNEGVNAVEKALALLDCFKPGEESLSLTALSQLSGYHKTTVYRLMNSLERMSYVVRRENGIYTLGPRLLYLGKLYEQSFHLASVVQPELQALASATNESASWYVIDNGQRLCVFRAESSDGLRHTRLPGSLYPLDNSAISQVLRHWGMGESLFTDAPDLPLYTSGARDPHTAAFAIPVFGEGDKLTAALALTGPSSRLTLDRKAAGLGDLMRDSAARLSAQLGARKPFCDFVYARSA
ncbi:IclR family transcriptional regulator [Pantoea allii]|uniref:IclR family transcriptional regulator n=1 Tax=Pantoea allii TaxID=574096 RepID=A0ABS6VIG1_9GAMM|nr:MULTISPECIES: IclR family transcriptional regulator [Pantoea]MBW1215762.1 IclR family transcriptional regulator [Pantoea allii]MBW1259132.1 IclR family transcriptional regulator [Pantoea allii]MBW1268321.1 IclR family transcriptional regulator [Pantoea allii]MBW1290328.1 IclR family transcriptional regulator [Pantoea allii]MCH9298663.1 IclR family transcriptional regulator [Pantoea allii]